MTLTRPTLRIIFFYGKPGAGKDTVAGELKKQHPDWAVVSTGNRIQEARRNSEDRLHSLIAPLAFLADQGEKLPTSVICNPENPQNSIFPDAISSALERGTTTIISTGFPKLALEQLYAFDAYLDQLRQKYNIDESHVLIGISDETALDRIAKRVAENERLGSPQRKDDSPAKAFHRLEVFRDQTMPIIEELSARGRLLNVSGEGTKDQTYTLVEEALDLRPALGIRRYSKER